MTPLRKLLIRAESAPWTGGIALWAYLPKPSGELEAFAHPLTVEATEDGNSRVYDPIVTIEESGAQQLLDDLWRIGLRPTEERITGEHLADLRKIAFAALQKLGLKL